MPAKLNNRIISMLVNDAKRHSANWQGVTVCENPRLIVICENISSSSEASFIQGQLTFAWDAYIKAYGLGQMTFAYSKQKKLGIALNRRDYVNVGA